MKDRHDTHRLAIFRRRRTLAVLVVIGCGLAASSASAQSFTDRFKNFFSGGSSAPPPVTAPAKPDDTGGLTCPDIVIRPGASTYAVGLPGKDPVGMDLRFQATIGRTARECNLQNGQVTAHIGIQGRVIVGPAGAPASVEVPLRIAVVQGGVTEKVITSKAYTTTVQMQSDSVPFTLVAEDVVYPAPSVADNDKYVFYIGFDPQALRPAPRHPVRHRRH